MLVDNLGSSMSSKHLALPLQVPALLEQLLRTCMQVAVLYQKLGPCGQCDEGNRQSVHELV